MVNEDFTGDESLRQLALEAQQHPPRSPGRQRALNQLMNRIMTSSRLSHPQAGNYPHGFYQDIYNEALQKTLLKICQKIDAYNPHHPVMAWVNFLLNKTFIDVVKDFSHKGLTYIPATQKKQMSIPSLSDLDGDPPTADGLTMAQLLQQFLEEDPEGLFQKEHIRDRPELTFQQIALAKYVEDQTWETLAQHFEISLQTLNSFFNRRLQKLMPYFQKYLQT